MSAQHGWQIDAAGVTIGWCVAPAGHDEDAHCVLLPVQGPGLREWSELTWRTDVTDGDSLDEELQAAEFWDAVVAGRAAETVEEQLEVGREYRRRRAERAASELRGTRLEDYIREVEEASTPEELEHLEVMRRLTVAKMLDVAAERAGERHTLAEVCERLGLDVDALGGTEDDDR